VGQVNRVGRVNRAGRVNRVGQVNRAGGVGQAGARTKNAYKIAPASNTERPRSKVRWQTLRRGNDEEWRTVFGKFDIGSDMSAGAGRGDGNRRVSFRNLHRRGDATAMPPLEVCVAARINRGQPEDRRGAGLDDPALDSSVALTT